MKLVYFNIQKHGIDDYLRKGRQILRFGPAVKSVLNLHMAETCGFLYVYIDVCLSLNNKHTVCKSSAVATTCTLCM